MEEEEKISCRNCKYFVQHYRIRNTWYDRVCCGHCVNTKAKLDRRKSLPYFDGCDYWEQAGEKIDEETGLPAIYNQLEILIKRIDEMKSLIKEELESD